MISRLARWWLARHDKPALPPTPAETVGWCCAPGCGAEVTGDDRHVVVAFPDDDLGITEGATGMAAEYCPEHCPGGCNHGCEEPPSDEVRDRWGRTPTECWEQGDVFRLTGSTVNGDPILPK